MKPERARRGLAWLMIGSMMGSIALGVGACRGDDAERAASRGDRIGQAAPPRAGTSADRFQDLDRALQPIRREFEEANGKVRLVAVVSPSCAHCQEAIDEIHAGLLRDVKSEELEVFIVWTSILPSDVRPRVQTLSKRWTDPRGHIYWDDNGHFARATGALLALEPKRHAYDAYLLYGRNDTWDPQATMREEPADFRALLAGWKPSAPRLRMEKGDRLGIQGFDLKLLTERVGELLAEPEMLVR